jgi:autotransporter-associated beta strand protein
MKSNSINCLPARILAMIVALICLSVTARAADRTWLGNGATPFWSDSANWDTVPGSGDNAIFSGGNQVVNSNDISGLSLGWVLFDAGGFNIGGNPLTVAGGITNDANASGATVSMNLTLSASQTFESDGGTLTFYGAITNGSSDINFVGAGSTAFNNILLGSGTSGYTVNMTGNSAVIFSNYRGSTIGNGDGTGTNLVINSGVAQFSSPYFNASPFGFGTLNVVINSGGTLSTTTAHALGGDNADLGTSWGQVWVRGGTLDISGSQYIRGGLANGLGRLVLQGATVNGSADLRTVDSATTTISSLASATQSTISCAGGIGVRGNLTFDVAANGVSGGDLAVSGPIYAATTGGIIKTNSGTLALSGANTYVGSTLIKAGTLILSSGGSIAKSSAITLSPGAVFDITAASLTLNTNQVLGGFGSVIGTLNDTDAGATGSAVSPGGSGAAGTLAMDGLSLSGNSLALNFDLANVTTVGAGVNDLLIVTNLTLSGSQTNLVNFSFLNGTPALGTYTIIQYSAGPAAGPITTLAAAASRYTFTFSSDGSSIKVTVAGTPGPLVWRGDGLTNNWDVGTTTNWMNGAVKDVFLQGDNATFDNTGSNTPPINVAASVQPTVLTFNATKDYTLGGVGKITGGGKLVKSNSGNLTILTGNDNSGNGSLNGSGIVTVGNGGTTGNLGGTGFLTNNTRVNFFESASVTYPGNLTGTGSLSSFMPGATLTVTGTNTFTGGLTISNGTFQIGNATAGSSVAGNITNYGTLNIYRSDAFTNLNNITSVGNTLEYGNGDINVRGTGGMTVDGSGSINNLPQGSLSIGQSAYGKLTVNPGAVINVGANFLLGNPNGAANNADVIQNGGTINVGNNVRIGHWATEVSTYTMNGGSINAPNNDFAVGWDGIGLMTLTSGTVTCRTLSIDDNGATAAINGTNSTFTMTGGQLNIGTGGISGNTATVKLAGGTIAAIAPAGFSSSLAMILTNGSPTFDSSNTVISLTGVLSGNGGLSKQGTGYLNLGGANTFTGAVNVAQGTLQGSGTILGPVTVQSGAALSAGSTLAAGTLTMSNLTVNPGAGLVFDLSSTTATGDQLVVKGPLALDTATPATFNFLGGTPFTGGPYTLITNWISGRTGHLVYNNPTRYAVTIDETNPLRINASFSGGNASLVWKGNVNNKWDVNADANWLNSGAADKYFQSDVVIFDSNGSGTPNVVLTSNMTPASVTVNSSGNYSFSGADIAGLGSLTKSGSGTLTLSNNVTLTGGVIVGGGTLQIGNGGTSGYVAGNITDYGSVVFNHSDPISYGVNPVNAATVVISGPGSLTQAGSGKLTILSTQNHYGGTTINPGSTIQLGNGPIVDSGSLGNSPATNNGAVIFYRLSNIAVATPYSGNGSFTFLGTGDSGQSGYSLNATNTFTGPVTLNLARIQSGAGAFSFGSPSSITVNPGSQVYAVATPFSSVYNIPLNLTGTGWQDGLGALRIENSGTWAGPITLLANSRIGVNNATTNTITGAISGAYELETFGGNAAASLVLAPASANSYNALRVSIGTAGASTVAGNANAIPNNIPLTMNGGTLKLNGFSKNFSSFYNLNSSSSIQNGSSTSPATASLTPVLGVSTYNGTFADGGPQPVNITLSQTPGLWTLNLTGSSPNWGGNLTNNGGAILIATGTSYMGNNNAPNRFLVNNNGGSFSWNINNVFGNGTANTFFPTIVLNSGSAVSNNNYNVIGPVVLNGGILGGSRNSTGYRRYQFRGPITVTGTTPSYIAPSGFGSGDHLDTSTVFNVADVTGNANSDLIVSDLLANRSADYGGAGGLVKTGNGTLELDGANAYTGPTTISNGVLKLGASGGLVSPTITIASGATLDVSAISGGLTLGTGQTLGGSGTVVGNLSDGSGTAISPGSSAGTLTVNGAFSLGGTCGLNIDLANVTTVGGGVNDLIQVNGDLNLSSGTPTVITFNFLNGAPAAGTYKLINCTGTINGTASTAFTNPPSRYVATYSPVGNSIAVTFSGSASNLVWTGTDPLTPATWDVNTSTNWFDGNAANTFFEFDTVRFDDTSVNTTVNLISSVTPTAITVDSTNAYSITGSGGIAGSTGLTKNNTNTLTVSTANSFTGPVNVNGGALVQGNNATLPRSARVTVATNAQLDFAGFGNDNTRAYSFTVGGSGPDGSGALINSGGAIFSFANVSNLTLTADTVVGGNNGRWDIGPLANSTLNGNGHSLTKVGSFQLDMRPQYITNVTSITVSNGNMYYESSWPQTNVATLTTTNFVAPGASLGAYGTEIVNMPVVLNAATIQNQNGGSGPALWTGNIVVSNTSLFNQGGAQTFSGVISGPGGVNVNGGLGILTLSNANSFAGGLTLSNGVATAITPATSGSSAILALNPAALGSGPVTINGSGYSSLATNSSFFGSNVLRAIEFAFAAPGAVGNAIVLPPGVVTNVSIQGRDSNQRVNLTGQISGGFPGMTNWVDFGDAGSAGVMRWGNTANTFLGNIYVDRGVLAITADGSLGNAANSLKLDQNSVNGGLRFDAAGINVAHGIVANTTTTLDVFGDNNGDGITDTANSATISGIISGAGAITAKCGTNTSPSVSGALTLSGNNTFTAALTVNAFTKVIASHANALGTTAAGTTVNLWGSLGLNLGGTYASEGLTLNGSGVAGAGALENLSGANIFNGTISLALPSTIGATAGSLTLGGVISGANPLTIVGAGAVTLNAANTYSAGTFVNGGTLVLNGSLPLGNAVTVATGGTLAGNGTINGPVTVQAGAALQPGVSAIGKLTVNSTLSLAGNTTMEISKTSGTNDAVVGISTVTYGGTLTVNNLGGTLAAGDKYVLFSAAERLGSFTTVNLPALTSGLVWTNKLAVDGSIQVMSTVNTSRTNITFTISGGSMNLSWPADHLGWHLQAQTNSAKIGLSNNWVTIPGSDTVTSTNMPINPANGSVFYRLVYP